jgi:hypothetical protein
MSDAPPGPADQAGDAPTPTYRPTPADEAPTYRPTPAGEVPADEPLRFLEARVTGVDAHRYRVNVDIDGNGFEGVFYNPLAYIPRIDEKVQIAVSGDLKHHPRTMWVLGIQSGSMFNSATYGRPPTAALWRDSSWPVDSGIQNLRAVEMDHKAWDTDNMLLELGNGQTTTRITPQRTGVYTVKAGGRWGRDPQSHGRRGMDLRWVDGGIIARDEKAPNSEGECGHSVSADVRITTSIDPAHASPWVRYLGAAVELVVYQTSGQSLSLMADRDPKPFLQMTYQGPMP